MENFNASVQVEVKDYKESAIDPTVKIYVVEVIKRDGEQWQVEQRYSEFDELNKNLQKIFNDLPSMPGKSLFKITDPEELKKRQEGLDSYLKGLVGRPDIFNSDSMKQFLQLDKHASEAVVNPPQNLGEVTGFAHGVRDFFVDLKNGVIFVLTADMNAASRLDAYLTNMKMPWEKEAPPTLLSVGTLECWYQKTQGQVQYQRIWLKTYPSQSICLNWETVSNFLMVGLDQGNINVLQVPADENYIRYDELYDIQAHDGRVMGVCYDNISGLIYSISEDKTFKVIEKGEITSVRKDSTSGLTSLHIDKEYKRAFIANRSGNVFIYDISSTPNIIHIMSSQLQGAIRGLSVDVVKNYVFTGGYDDGEIGVFNIEKPGKEKFAKQTASLQGKNKVRFISWSTGRGEVIVGCEDGTITFWNAKQAQPIYVLKSHSNDITKLQWFEDKQILVTSSKQKSIKFWSIPKEWRDKKLEAEQERESEQRRKEENLLKREQQIQQNADDSDQDDLAGWHQY